MAAFNGICVQRMLGLPRTGCRDAGRVRDWGESSDHYIRLFPDEPMVAHWVIKGGTLLAYYRGAKADASLARASAVRAFPRQGRGLRLCTICFEQDVAQFGTGLWHTVHQLPLTHACAYHRSELRNVAMPEAMRLPFANDRRNASCSRAVGRQLTRLAMAGQAVFEARQEGSEYAQLVRQMRSFIASAADWDVAGRLCSCVVQQLNLVPSVDIFSSFIQPWHLTGAIRLFLELPEDEVDPLCATIVLAAIGPQSLPSIASTIIAC